MLKLIQVGNAMPVSYPVDSTSEFQPGQIGQIKLLGQDIVVGLSDGTAPLGIIDDIRTTAFTQNAVDEVLIIRVPEPNITSADGYNYFSNADIKEELDNSRILKTSFVADYDGLILNTMNGVVTLPSGSRLRFRRVAKSQSHRVVASWGHRVEKKGGKL